MNSGMNVVFSSARIDLDDGVVNGGGGLVVSEDVDVFRRFLDAEPLNFALVFGPLAVVTAVGPVEILSRVKVSPVTQSQRQIHLNLIKKVLLAKI